MHFVKLAQFNKMILISLTVSILIRKDAKICAKGMQKSEFAFHTKNNRIIEFLDVSMILTLVFIRVIQT